MTEGTYRKKALPHLLSDFGGRCAYCLDPGDFRHPSLNHVDHFNCKLTGRKRHQYSNLMLGCAACNLEKHDKPVRNPLNAEQRLLNCTNECEFPEHITETEDGQWVARSPAGKYHLGCIGLSEKCHVQKRAARRQMAERILALCATAIRYQSINPAELHDQTMQMPRCILKQLNSFPPLVTEEGVLPVKEWLRRKGLNVDLLS